MLHAHATDLYLIMSGLLQVCYDRTLLECSLCWLRGFGGNYEILGAPFDDDNQLKPDTVGALTNVTCYLNAYKVIFPADKLDGNGGHSFWPLIHGLARNGIYAIDDGQSVNHTVLSQTKPFNESSHVALTDALMRAQISVLVTIPRVVRVIRRISPVNSVQDIPITAEGGLFLWLSKIAEYVHKNPLMQRGLDVAGFAKANCMLEAVRGGQYLPSLLVFYLNVKFTLKNFYFKRTTLSAEKAFLNTKIFAEFCQSHLPPYTFHIEPAVLVNSSNNLLHTNVLVLLARIFDHFEPSTASSWNRANSSNVCGIHHSSMTKKRLLPLRHIHKPSSLVLVGEERIDQTQGLKEKNTPLQETNPSKTIETSVNKNNEICSSSSMVPSEDLETPSPCVLEKSFLVDKKHTEASASMAGLPIIRAKSPINDTKIRNISRTDTGFRVVDFNYDFLEGRETELEEYISTHFKENKGTTEGEQLWRDKLKEENEGQSGCNYEAQPNDIFENPWLIHTGPVRDDHSHIKSEGGLGMKLRRKHKERKQITEVKKENGFKSALNNEKLSDASDRVRHDCPEYYVKPHVKSNQRLIKNALCHVCLAGDVNLPAKQLALNAIEDSSAHHFLILLKQIINLTFRGLYSYSELEEKALKIYGAGPRVVETHMVAKFYKYNTGSKEFYRLHSYSFSLSVDAFTLKPNTRKEKN